MDENYEDCRIDVGYRMAIAPWRARSYIEGGKEDFCGFAIDAAQVSGMKEVGDFIDLFCGAIAPAQFSPSEPIHILEVPTNPFVQASRAVGPSTLTRSSAGSPRSRRTTARGPPAAAAFPPIFCG